MQVTSHRSCVYNNTVSGKMWHQLQYGRTFLTSNPSYVISRMLSNFRHTSSFLHTNVRKVSFERDTIHASNRWFRIYIIIFCLLFGWVTVVSARVRWSVAVVFQVAFFYGQRRQWCTENVTSLHFIKVLAV